MVFTNDFDDILKGKAEDFKMERMKEFCDFMIIEKASSWYVDDYGEVVLQGFMETVLETVLKGYKNNEDFELSAEERKRRRLIMHCLVNAANRSEVLCSCGDEYTEKCFLMMLKVDWLQNEAFACIINFSKPENGETYYKIAFELCMLWGRVCADMKEKDKSEALGSPILSGGEAQIDKNALAKIYEKRSWLLAIFAHYLESDDDFLAICGEKFESSTMDIFIDILDTLLQLDKKGARIRFSSSNLDYTSTFLEKALRRFGSFDKNDAEDEDKQIVGDDKSNVLCVPAVVEIILNLARRKAFRRLFTEGTATAQLILYVMEGYEYFMDGTLDELTSVFVCDTSLQILHYEYLKYHDTEAVTSTCRERSTAEMCTSEDKFTTDISKLGGEFNAASTSRCGEESSASISTHEKETIEPPFMEPKPRAAAALNCIRQFARALKMFDDVDLIEALKISCMELLGILCCKNDLIRNFMGENDGISLLLRCMLIREGQNPMGRLFAIATLRHLIVGHWVNQERLYKLGQKPSAIMSRRCLIEEINVRAICDHDSKKFRFMKPERD